MDFPLRENCSPDDPEEAFVWMLVALPGMKGGQLLMPVEYLKQISKRLWDCGARPVEEPVIEYQRPSGNEAHWLTSPGKWIPAGSGPPLSEDALVDASLAKMGFAQKAELFNALCAWERGHPIPENPAGEVVGTLTDPQRAKILSRLRKGGE